MENEECMNCGHEDFEHHDQDGCIVCGCTKPKYESDNEHGESEDMFDVSECKIIDGRELCPECYEHEQLDLRKVNEIYRKDNKWIEVDCKNLFFRVVDGKKEVVSQCCCYSIEHHPDILKLKENPIRWMCECGAKHCSLKQNERPNNSNCSIGLQTNWYAGRWLLYSEPNPDYEIWLEHFGTEADRILWEQEKKDRLGENEIKED